MRHLSDVIVFCLLVGLLLVSPTTFAAESAGVPSDADVAAAAARYKIAPPSEAAIDEVVKRNQVTEEMLKGIPVPAMPDVDKLPVPQAPILDVGQLAEHFDAQSPVIGGPQLIVFVSFSMPQASLKKLVEQASRTQALLVLRGMSDEGSMVKTLARIKELIGNRSVAWQIDPQAFKRFGIRSVPTFVLVAAGTPVQSCDKEDTCDSLQGFARLSGDVTLDYALEKFAKAPGFARVAAVFTPHRKVGR